MNESEMDAKIEAIFDKADDLMINQKNFKEAVIKYNKQYKVKII